MEASSLWPLTTQTIGFYLQLIYFYHRQAGASSCHCPDIRICALRTLYRVCPCTDLSTKGKMSLHSFYIVFKQNRELDVLGMIRHVILLSLRDFTIHEVLS